MSADERVKDVRSTEETLGCDLLDWRTLGWPGELPREAGLDR